jgi:hypothetical protein
MKCCPLLHTSNHNNHGDALSIWGNEIRSAVGRGLDFGPGYDVIRILNPVTLELGTCAAASTK